MYTVNITPAQEKTLDQVGAYIERVTEAFELPNGSVLEDRMVDYIDICEESSDMTARYRVNDNGSLGFVWGNAVHDLPACIKSTRGLTAVVKHFASEV